MFRIHEIPQAQEKLKATFESAINWLGEAPIELNFYSKLKRELNCGRTRTMKRWLLHELLQWMFIIRSPFLFPSFAEGKQKIFRNNLENTKLRKVCARNQIWDSFNSIQKLFTEFVTQHLPLQSLGNSLKTKLSSSWNSQAQIFKWHNLLSGYCLHERRFKNYANSSFFREKNRKFKGEDWAVSHKDDFF